MSLFTETFFKSLPRAHLSVCIILYCGKLSTGPYLCDTSPNPFPEVEHYCVCIVWSTNTSLHSPSSNPKGQSWSTFLIPRVETHLTVFVWVTSPRESRPILHSCRVSSHFSHLRSIGSTVTNRIDRACTSLTPLALLGYAIATHVFSLRLITL